MWTVILSKQAHKFITELAGKDLSTVENCLTVLVQNPHAGKMLKGELKGYCSLRAGHYRIIYSIKHNELKIWILKIHHRKEVYEKFRR